MNNLAATEDENNTGDVLMDKEMELETKRHRVLKPLQFCSGIMTSDLNNTPPTAYLDKPTPNICTAEAHGKSALSPAQSLKIRYVFVRNVNGKQQAAGKDSPPVKFHSA